MRRVRICVSDQRFRRSDPFDLVAQNRVSRECQPYHRSTRRPRGLRAGVGAVSVTTLTAPRLSGLLAGGHRRTVTAEQQPSPAQIAKQIPRSARGGACSSPDQPASEASVRGVSSSGSVRRSRSGPPARPPMAAGAVVRMRLSRADRIRPETRGDPARPAGPTATTR
jgi:hypothetical protein